MNGTAFGFPQYPQRPSVKPQQVGQALQQMKQPAASSPFDPIMAAALGNAPQPAAPAPASPPRFSSMPAFAPDATATRQPQDPDPDPAVKVAIENAMDRMASGGASAGQQGSGNPNNPTQLARMGLSPLEIKLLWMSGGSRY